MTALTKVKLSAVIAAVFAVGMGVSAPAPAQTMYKCADTSGKVNYQTKPCEAGKQQLWARESEPVQKQPDPVPESKPTVSSLKTVSTGTRTVGGRPACLSEDWYDDFTKLMGNGDVDSMTRYVEMKRCMLLKPDIRVTVIDGPALFRGYVTFVANGIKFWGAMDSLHYE